MPPPPGRDIAWADLAPDSAPPLVGGFGVVFSARWQKKRVAVKVPIAVVLAGAAGGDLGGVLAEAATLVRASDDGVTDLSVYDCVPGSNLGVDLWVDSPNPPGYRQP